MDVGISLCSIKTVLDLKDFIDSCSCIDSDSSPKFELSYIHDNSFLDEIEFVHGQVLSAHAATPRSEYFPNFGSHDDSVIRYSQELIVASAKTCRRFGGEILVLHPGYTTDAALPVSGDQRLNILSDLGISSAYESRLQQGINTTEFLSSDLYQRYFARAVKNLERANSLSADEGCVLAVENLNPRISYLFQKPEEFQLLVKAIPGIGICLDVGHLWLSSLAHDFDFMAGLKEILLTDKVVSVHLHNNDSEGAGTAFGLQDQHHFPLNGRLPMLEVMDLLKEYSDLKIIMETVDADAGQYLNISKYFEQEGDQGIGSI